jgi:hypothetical protein
MISRACILLLFVLAAEQPGRFVRQWWFEHGVEHGNPGENRRFRVNSPEVVLHPVFGSRVEARSSGMLQIRMEEDHRLLDGAELYTESRGGHPGTANKRVSINTRWFHSNPDWFAKARTS